MDRGAWRATVHCTRKGQTRLSNWAHTHILEITNDHTTGHSGVRALWTVRAKACLLTPQATLNRVCPQKEQECGTSRDPQHTRQVRNPTALLQDLALLQDPAHLSHPHSPRRAGAPTPYIPHLQPPPPPAQQALFFPRSTGLRNSRPEAYAVTKL